MERLQVEEATAPSRIPTLADLPTFRRAKPQDALDVARALFIAEERLDMGSLAERLGVNRGTLYRWFGSRDQLVEQMLVQLAEAFSVSAHAAAQWEGDERVLDFARRVMDATAHFQPLRTFVAREPELALRLLIGERGAVHRSLAEALSAEVAKAHSETVAEELESRIDGIVRLAASLQWATIAIGEEPQIEELVDYIRAVLIAARAMAEP
jgi:AcrR family transcriptional regulator